MKLKGKKILITGADGFIGSHLTERCIAAGASVRAFVYYNSFNQWGWLDTVPKKILDKHEVFAGDIRDFGCVLEACQDIDIVFHLAALISIPYSYRAPDSFVATNITGTMNVLQAARILGVKKVVHTSTSEVYGTAQYVPIDENHPINPQSPYAATKSAADSLAVSFYRSFDLPVTVLRPFNTFGPRQSARAVIPTIISQILAGCKVIKLGNVESIRDLNYIGNTIDAFIHLAQTDKGLGQVFNTGSGVEVSVGEVAAIIQKILGVRVKIEMDKQRIRPVKSEVEKLVCSCVKLNNLTGWQPEISLEQGLRRTCAWIKKHMNHYKTDIYNV
ncbi:MAG: GDP-mannose 4,6-dehydratase [Candidatus Omnitrophica bacterium]|nr:GDP-mannose 4,6-dehydratase [Candidatus Omnitrophota bacterium]